MASPEANEARLGETVPVLVDDRRSSSSGIDGLEGIVESEAYGATILARASGPTYRRVIYTNSYGGRDVINRIRTGQLASNHLWGCIELVRRGYEVAFADPLPDFYWHRRPLPHDLSILKLVHSWLGSSGLIYCGHNVLYWLPALCALRVIHCPVVSLLFAREPLKWASGHTGILALTAAAAEHARAAAPRAKVAHLGWGADLASYPAAKYSPQRFLSCGVTLRDQQALCEAARMAGHPLTVITSVQGASLPWPSNVEVVTHSVSFDDLVNVYYRNCLASIVALRNDPAECTAVGMTNVIEAMALARPVIVTKTGALPSQIDVEQSNCGLFVEPGSPHALAAAMNRLATDLRRAESMGASGRRLCESYYNSERFGAELHDFFESL